MTSSSNFFMLLCFSCHFSYWSKFSTNIVIDSRVMTIFIYNGLTRNLEIGTIPVYVLPNVWTLGQVRDSKFGTNVSNKMLLVTARFYLYNVH